jgi:putative holliday junction resolvase
MSRIMSIDYGDVRIGIALTDPLKIIASGYVTLQNNHEICKNIHEICKEKDIDTIVFGMPYDADSKMGIAADKVVSFANDLLKYFESVDFTAEFYEEDERYTTIDAIRSMREIKVKNKKKKNVVDQIAAANILRAFMENKSKVKFEKNK